MLHFPGDRSNANHHTFPGVRPSPAQRHYMGQRSSTVFQNHLPLRAPFRIRQQDKSSTTATLKWQPGIDNTDPCNFSPNGKLFSLYILILMLNRCAFIVPTLVVASVVRSEVRKTNRAQGAVFFPINLSKVCNATKIQPKVNRKRFSRKEVNQQNSKFPK